MKVICTRCGGTNIACGAIVNPNTGKIIDYLDESFMHANCGDCKEEVVITVEEPTDDDWLNAVSNLFDSYTYDVKNTDVDKFKMSDVMNVYRIINL